MTESRLRPTGLGPSIRQVMIVVLWAALLLTVFRFAARWHFFHQPAPIFWLVVPVLVACYPMPWLALLLRLGDRPGPVRTWWVSACLATAGLVAGVSFLGQDLLCFLQSGQPTGTFPLAPLMGLMALWSGARQWQSLTPGLCPSCGRRSVIALRRRRKPSIQGWCARCGALKDLGAAIDSESDRRRANAPA